LVADWGFNAGVWELAAARLARDGAVVYAVAIASLEELQAVLTLVAEEHPTLRRVGVGHGVGGTAVMTVGAAKRGLLHAVVGIGAPLSFARATAAFIALHAIGHGWDRAYDHSGPNGQSLGALLLSDRLPATPHLWAAGSAKLLPAAEELTAEIGTIAPLVELLRERADLPGLFLMSPKDGYAPPWQSDPGALGLRRDNMERHYLARANGSDREYGHLDLILDPESEALETACEWIAR
jgi:hypothetical protein